MKGALQQGPIGVIIAADCVDFYLYSTGIFTGDGCADTTEALDHAV